MSTTKKPVCPSCGGSGEIAFFGGESRFLLTREECPLCAGRGYLLDEDIPADKTAGTTPETRKKA